MRRLLCESVARRSVPRHGRGPSVQLGEVWQRRSILETGGRSRLCPPGCRRASALTGSPSDAPGAAKANCPKADATPGEASTDQLGDAVLCLIAKERRKADLKAVEPNGALTRVAEKHTDVMLEENCLDHRCDGEKPLKDRIVKLGLSHYGGPRYRVRRSHRLFAHSSGDGGQVDGEALSSQGGARRDVSRRGDRRSQGQPED